MPLSLFRTVRGRLLALMVAIVLPIACLTAAAAVATYRTVFEAIHTSQMRAADDFAVRARVWYRGALRSLVTSATAIRAMSPPGDACERIAGKALAAVSDYEALLLRVPGRPDCLGGLDGSVPRGEIAAVADQLAMRAPIKLWVGTEFDGVESNPLFGIFPVDEAREDTLARVGAALSWAVTPRFLLTARAVTTDRDADLGPVAEQFFDFDYERTVVAVGFRWSWLGGAR